VRSLVAQSMVAVFVVACTGSEEPDNRLPTAVAWEFEHAPPTLEHEWFSTQTLPELSLLRTTNQGWTGPPLHTVGHSVLEMVRCSQWPDWRVPSTPFTAL
jgi:hypothetical protein